MPITKPAIVLLRPQLPENIGMVARAMDNCGIEKLILVNPRDKWPNKKALSSSANSKDIILNASVYDSAEEALTDYHFVIATSARKRYLQKPLQNNFDYLFNQFPNSKKTAILFGPENSGLSNDDLKLADVIFHIETSKSNSSLNLSHAVLLFAYNWRDFFILKKNKPINNQLNNKKASKKNFIYFMKFLEKELNDVGFLHPKTKSKSMLSNIETMFIRASLSETEIKTLWGMVKKLKK